MKHEYWYVMVLIAGDPVFITDTYYNIEARYTSGGSPKDFGTKEYALDTVYQLSKNSVMAYAVCSRYELGQPTNLIRDNMKWDMD